MNRQDRKLGILLVILALGVSALSWWFSQSSPSNQWQNGAKRQTPINGRMSLVLGEKISINEATAMDLTALPGIGPGRAKNIVEWREKKGPFESLNQLEQVEGIGKRTVKKIENYLLIKNRTPEG